MDDGDILPPLNKRKRLDNTMVEPPKDGPITRSSEFWFDDGSVVLQVEKTQFRVHRSILSSNSTFFADMFALPQPTNDATVEGCPVVCMHDATVDWENLLMFLYFPARLENMYYCELPAHFLSSLLRLGQKYQFDLIKENAFSRLKAHVPGSLEAWDANFNPLRDQNDCTYPEEIDDLPWLVGWEFEVVTIALELSIQSVLPVAYYLCAVTRSTSDILDGLQYTAMSNITTHLPSKAQHVVISGREKLHKMAAKRAADLCSPETVPCRICTNTQKCTEEFQRLTHYFLHDVGSTDRCRFILNSWPWWTRIWFNFCPGCSNYLQNTHELGRQASWESLPLLFDLPHWRNLKDFDD